MNFNDYQKATNSTAKYPEAGEGTIMALAYVGLGLGEAGEIQGKIKKIIRDSDGVITPEVKREIAKELGDLLWYVARAGVEIDYPLSNIAEGNLAKLQDRKDRGVIGGSGDNR
jgi:NTP pyrophosphatase (non-canonical NTP hydrolase)